MTAGSDRRTRRDSGAPPRRRRRTVVWPLFLLAAAVVGVALMKGQDIRSVDPTSGKVEFYSSGEAVSESDVSDGQQALEGRVRDLEERAREQAGGAQAPDPGQVPGLVDLNGVWTGDNGLRYQIQQYGQQSVISEVADFGVSATGSGVVSGDTVTYDYWALNGTYGRATLRLTGPRTLEGTFQNLTTGQATPARLTR